MTPLATISGMISTLKGDSKAVNDKGGPPLDPQLSKEAGDLAAALSKVTSELDKLNTVMIAGAANGGEMPEEMNPEIEPAIPKGGLPDIDAVGREVFITPKTADTDNVEGPLDALGDKALSAANALQELYDKLMLSPPDEALVAGAAYGITPQDGFAEEGAEDGMALDSEVPLTPDEKIAEVQETEEAIGAIKQESADKDAAQKAKEAEMAKKNIAGLIGMTKVGQKTMGAINRAEALKNAVTNVAEGITTAVKSAPFPINIPAIAFATAQGAAQIATIKGQFHSGIDSVPENGTYLLEQGERVLDKRLNADLKGYLGGQGKGDNVRIDNAVTMSFSEGTTEDQVYEAKMKFEEMLRDVYDEYATPSPFDA